MPEIQNSLRTLYNEGRFFDSRDPLVSIEKNSSKVFCTSTILNEIPLSELPRNLVQEAKAMIRENGSNPMCIVDTIIRVNNDQTFPLLLKPINFTSNKVKNMLVLEATEELMINPYLPIYLESYELISPQFIQDLLFKVDLDEREIDFLKEFLDQSGIKVEYCGMILGNFHPHRFSYLKDIDLMLRTEVSEAVSQLLTGEKDEIKPLLLGSKNLFDADKDQVGVSQRFELDNMAVIGPPGTGKSQFLANLIGKLLNIKSTVLVVSEKRTALEVIQNRLKEVQLEQLCFIHTSYKDRPVFINQLKENWKRVETYKSTPIHNNERSQSLLQNLQFILDVLQQPDTIGGVSLETYFELTKHVPEGKILPKPPGISEWQSKQQVIQSIYTNDISFVLNIPFETISHFEVSELIQELEDLVETYKELQVISSFSTKAELEKLKLRLSFAQITQNDFYKEHASIFVPDSSQQKKVLRTIKKYRKIKSNLEQIKPSTHWRRQLAIIELKDLHTAISEAKGWKLGLKKKWKKVSRANFELSAKLIQHELELHELEAELSDTLQILSAFGIQENETMLIEQWIRRYSSQEWNEINTIAQELNHYPKNVHSIVQTFSDKLNSTLTIDAEVSIISVINNLIQKSNSISANWHLLQSVSKELYMAIQVCDSEKSLENAILASNWVYFTSQYPGLSNFSTNGIVDKITEVLNAQKLEQQLFSKEILNRQKQSFEEMEELLQTPSRKLNEEQKIRKHLLRKGKAILAKEFAKKTRHISLYNLFNSEAKEWVQMLIPIIMCNTNEVANLFPFEKSLFDTAIFDEASQIPLYSAIGSVQRADRLVIAGDDQQMRPVKAFSSRSEEITDILTQGLLYLKSDMLKHHYRSHSEKLIAFSNKYFYHDKLIAFPSYPPNNQAIQKVKIDGIYTERKNIEEAKAIAKKAKEKIRSGENVGIVAFSEEQIDLIWNQFSAREQEELSEAIDHGKAFLKPVEKVQGDECDVLLISFTFGKNAEGKFKYTFGPMSTAHGTNRLNVLLTRARKQLLFYTSVDYVDFRISNNPSVELIRKWFQFIENVSNVNETIFPFNIHSTPNGNNLYVNKISEHVSDALELCTMHKVLTDRGWKIAYH